MSPLAKDPVIARTRIDLLKTFQAALTEWHDRMEQLDEENLLFAAVRGPLPPGREIAAARVVINRYMVAARQAVIDAGVYCTVSAHVAGAIVENIDPFRNVLGDTLGLSLIPDLLDMIEQAIGVYEQATSSNETSALPGSLTLVADELFVLDEVVADQSRHAEPTKLDHILLTRPPEQADALRAAVTSLKAKTCLERNQPLAYLHLTPTGLLASSYRAEVAALAERLLAYLLKRLSSDGVRFTHFTWDDLKAGGVVADDAAFPRALTIINVFDIYKGRSGVDAANAVWQVPRDLVEMRSMNSVRDLLARADRLAAERRGESTPDTTVQPRPMSKGSAPPGGVPIVDSEGETMSTGPGETPGHAASSASQGIAVRRSRVQLLDLQREVAAAKPETFKAVAAHVANFAGGLPPGATQDQLRGHAGALAQDALSTERRGFGLRAIGALCRHLQRDATFQPSPNVDDRNYAVFLRAAAHEDGKLPGGCSLSLVSIDRRSRLQVPDLHAAVARALDGGLAYVSDIDAQPYSIQINDEDVTHALGELERAPRREARPVAEQARPASGSATSGRSESLLRILHISDLHERAAFAGMPKEREARLQWDAEERGYVLGSRFTEALRELGEDGVDIVCFTGDLADWGHPSEYAVATARLNAILEAVSVPRSRFFAVPGNHDVQRNVHKDAWEGVRNWLADAHHNRPRVGRWFREVGPAGAGLNSEWREQILQRTDEFWKWLDAFRGPELRPSAPKLLGYRYTLPGGTFKNVDVPIHIVGLDSAWMCGGDDDQGRILLTEEQVQAHVRDGARPLGGLRIGLVHHPLDHLADHPDVRRLLGDDGVDLLLHGHQHDPCVMVADEPGARLRVLAAGCLMEGDSGKDWPNGFQLIEVDARSKAGAVHFRKWARKGRFWAKGSDLYRDAPDGVLTWPGVGPPDPH